MEDRWGPDPTSQMWERWRRPVLVFVAIVFIVSQWERFASGQPFLIVTGVGVAAFWTSVIFTRASPEPARRTDGKAWRTNAQRRLLVFGLWTVAALGWLLLAALLYSVRPLNLVVPALPALLVALEWWKYHKADRLAELQQRAVNP